jgi:hypothetical protein
VFGRIRNNRFRELKGRESEERAQQGRISVGKSPVVGTDTGAEIETNHFNPVNVRIDSNRRSKEPLVALRNPIRY